MRIIDLLEISKTLNKVLESPNSEDAKKRKARARLVVQYTLITYGILIIIAALSATLIMSFDWQIKLDLPKELIEFVRSLPVMIIALIFGTLGASIRLFAPLTESSDERKSKKLVMLYIGGVMGIAAYLLLKTKAFITIAYDSAFTATLPDPTFHGIALFSFIAGMFAKEIVCAAEQRAKTIIAKDDDIQETDDKIE